jgi:DNA excision repair protein ERCC-6
MLRRQDSISIPTWTGRSGAAGAPGEVRRRFGSKINSELVSGLNSTECSRINGASTSQGSSTGLVGASLGKALSSRDLLARIQGNRESAIGAGDRAPDSIWISPKPGEWI